jgi:hypothetical protein
MGQEKNFARILRRMLASSLFCVAASGGAQAYTSLEPGALALASSTSIHNAVGVSHEAVTIDVPDSASKARPRPGSGLPAGFEPAESPVYNAASDDAPPVRALVLAMLTFAILLSARKRPLAPAPARAASETPRLNTLEICHSPAL